MRASKVITITPVIEAGAYAAGDLLGTFTKLPDAVLNPGGVCVLKSLLVLNTAANTVDPVFDVLFWDREPVIASADNAAFDVTDANLLHLIGMYSVAAADNKNFANNSATCYQGINLVLKALGPRNAKVTTGKDLWVNLVERGGATYGSTSALILKFGLEQI